MKCNRCRQTINKDDLFGVNIFDAQTGTHVITRWYCRFCARVVGLIVQ